MWDPDTSCGMYQIERFQLKFLNFVAYKLKIYHPLHDYSPVLYRLDIKTLAGRRFEANLTFFSRLIDSTELLTPIIEKINHYIE